MKQAVWFHPHGPAECMGIATGMQSLFLTKFRPIFYTEMQETNTKLRSESMIIQRLWDASFADPFSIRLSAWTDFWTCEISPHPDLCLTHILVSEQWEVVFLMAFAIYHRLRRGLRRKIPKNFGRKCEMSAGLILDLICFAFVSDYKWGKWQEHKVF